MMETFRLIHKWRQAVWQLPAIIVLAGILAFLHPRAEEVHRMLHDREIHIMSQAGRLRVAIHGYNTAEDVEFLLRSLAEALRQIA